MSLQSKFNLSSYRNFLHFLQFIYFLYLATFFICQPNAPTHSHILTSAENKIFIFSKNQIESCENAQFKLNFASDTACINQIKTSSDTFCGFPAKLGKEMASRLYAALIGAATPMVPTKLMPLWNHAAGPKTVFFWAPGEHPLDLQIEPVSLMEISLSFQYSNG